MNRSPQRGIALVITLIMLAVVTITAVAFLAVARRERLSVSAAGDQLDAQFAADIALQRAQAEVASRMIAASNRFDFALAVSTNWQNAVPDLAKLGALANETLPTGDIRIFTNAAPYTYFNIGTAGGLENYRASLGNLFYDPRPPVFANTNRFAASAPEFRFYLDLNRNGRFESNGLQVVFDRVGRIIGTNTFVGDPEYIGVLEHPGLPHGPTNRFTARWAYVIVPAGRTLDLNYLYNDTKDRRVQGGGFMRNQGVATFEGNLAAYLTDLNTNVWPTNTYNFRPALGSPSTGLAFADADRLFQFRRGTPLQPRADTFYEGSTPFGKDHIDGFGDGPIPATLAEFKRPQDYIFQGAGGAEDTMSRRWPGTDSQRQYFDLTRLLDGGLGARLETRLSGRRTSANVPLNSTYDRTTFYRLLGSLGTDTGDGRYESGVSPAGVFFRRARLNLNYMPDGDPNTDTTASADIGRFRDWTPIAWYTNAAHRMLLTEFTNGLPDLALLTNNRTAHLGHGIAIHGTNIIRGATAATTVTNIYRWDGAVHRVLQVAANIYDASHAHSTARPGNPRDDLPSAFRPILYRQVTNGTTFVRLAGFQEVTNLLAVGRPWIDLDNPVQVARLPLNPDVRAILADKLDFNAYGIPYIIGAKKGLPNFQEGFWQTRVDVTRRLRVIKGFPLDTLTRTNERPWEDARFRAETQYRYDVTNIFGMDALNSYALTANRADLTLIATNYYDFAIIDENAAPGRPPIVLFSGSRSAAGTVLAGKWTPQLYMSPLNTGFGTNFVYDQFRRILYPGGQTNSGYADVRAPAPRLAIAFTNRLVYMAVDKTGRLLDMVNLKSVMYETNAMHLLAMPGTAGTAGIHMSQFWNTNIVAGGQFLQRGIASQFDGSIGSDVAGKTFDIPNSLWADAPGVRPAGQQNEYEKDGLYYFLFRRARRAGYPVTPQTQAKFGGIVAQTGFTPTASIVLTDRRQANDPLVHYTTDDLAPGMSAYTSPEGYAEIKIPNEIPLTSLNGKITIDQRSLTNHLGNRAKVVSAGAPWGVNADLGTAAPVPVADPSSTAFDVAYKDSLVKRPDDWNFPTNKFPNVGWLGRVHRGTPWQTIYLKGIRPESGNRSVRDRYLGIKSWAAWSGNARTQPTNDWNILDLFTSAVNDNTARGLLGVNQTEPAAWSAVFSGVPVLTNAGQGLATRFIAPATPELRVIVDSINAARALYPANHFERVGQILAAPGLGVGALGTNQYALGFSPFVTPFNRSTDRVTRKFVPAAVPDEVIEQIPQLTLSLLRADEPRVVVYAFGQALKPAPNSIVTRPGPFFGLCTNYVVTSEFATRTAVRLDGAPRSGQLHTVVEDHRVLPPEN